MENYLHAELARSRLADQLDEAEVWRRSRRIVVARRLSRRAERAALQARLTLARST